jgi:NAD(P)-dependent dehydrogenase (short-subunit alcohol dehydrogenase family)
MSNWLITGCSTGIGREIAIVALERGHCVAASARNPDTLNDLVASYPGRAIAVRLDVTKPDQVAAAVAETEARLGSVDVLVNNAGYGYLAAIEEGEDAKVRAMFETNFFGALAMIKAVLPGMRKRRSGFICNISSMAGLVSNPGTGYYSSTKFALEGMTEALSRELAPLGIRASAVEPGPFRTDWSGRSLVQTETPIADYAEHVGARRAFVASVHGKQPGDPRKAAEAVVDLEAMAAPPMHLLLGRPVLEMYRAKLAEHTRLLDDWEAVTLGADYPA